MHEFYYLHVLYVSKQVPLLFFQKQVSLCFLCVKYFLMFIFVRQFRPNVNDCSFLQHLKFCFEFLPKSWVVLLHQDVAALAQVVLLSFFELLFLDAYNSAHLLPLGRCEDPVLSQGIDHERHLACDLHERFHLLGFLHRVVRFVTLLGLHP